MTDYRDLLDRILTIFAVGESPSDCGVDTERRKETARNELSFDHFWRTVEARVDARREPEVARVRQHLLVGA